MAASQSDSIYSVFSLIERSRPKISTAAMKQPAPKSSTAGIKGVFLSLREDVDRARDRFQVITKDLPAATGRYCLQKVPVVSWITNYSPRWLVNDLIAGLTVGIILVPQALAYAKIAGIPLQDGLLASWLPSIVYFVMGTSKDLSTGPTSIIGLTTAQVIREVMGDNPTGAEATAVASAVAFSVGIYCFILGMLNLGWLLEVVSVPVLNGFVGGAAITIMMGQIPAIFGESPGGLGIANQIHDIFAKLPETQGLTYSVGLSGILLLLLLQLAGTRWGKKYQAVWYLGIGRNAITIFLFTLISYLLNRNRSINHPLFALTGRIPAGLVAPVAPSLELAQQVFTKSLPVCIAAALEHIAIGKAIGRVNGYTIDQSQELTYLGVINLLNSFVNGMPVGAAFSRTAVSSAAGVKSPISGIFVTGAVLLCIYVLTGALFWIPKATLSAVVIMAVVSIIPSPSVFYRYWKTSFIDFIGSMLTFWLTLFMSAEVGIEIGALWMVAVTLVRMVFERGTSVRDADYKKYYGGKDESTDVGELPTGTHIVRLTSPIMFLNATKIKSSILDASFTYYSSPLSDSSAENSDPNRLWCNLSSRRIRVLRKKAGITPQEANFLPYLNVLILDMAAVRYMDVTALVMLRDMRAELKAWAGADITIKFVGLETSVLRRMERDGWVFRRMGEDGVVTGENLEKGENECDEVHGSVKEAVEAMCKRSVFGNEQRWSSVAVRYSRAVPEGNGPNDGLLGRRKPVPGTEGRPV